MEEKELQQEEVKVEEVKSEPDWKDMYLRLYADMDNLKKRTIKEKEEIRLKTKLDTLQSVLELDNDLHLAQKMIKDESSLKAVKIVTDKLINFLKSKGFEEIQTETYDEDLHEVISVIPSEETKIIDVASKGYTLNGKPFRYPKKIGRAHV